MRILIVATKPPHPARDGGRLALWHMLHGLADAGHELALVAPVVTADHSRSDVADAALPYRMSAVEAQPRGVLAAAARALAKGCSLGVARHSLAAVRHAVADTISRWQPHVVHAEQLHAFANAAPARDAAIPLVLRMQNVESSLRVQQAHLHPALFALHLEAARLRTDERAAVARATHTIALTDEDASALRRLRTEADVSAIAPAFPAVLPTAAALDGDPAVALAGSGWWPNADGERWLLREVWPLVVRRLPRALLHCFGGGALTHAQVLRHAAPADSRAAFPAGAIAIVPLRAGSGIRMRILEAWARGLPVVATPTATRGLAVRDGVELLLAQSPTQFADAIARIHADATLRDQLVSGGRAYLQRHHDIRRQTRALVGVYQRALGQP